MGRGGGAAEKWGMGVGAKVKGREMTKVEASGWVNFYVNRYSFGVSSLSRG